MSNSAELSRGERRIEFIIGALFIVYTIRTAPPIFAATLIGFAIVWIAVVFSLPRRQRKSFRFDQRLLVVLIVIGLIWIMFGLALATGERSEDPSILPTLIAMGGERSMSSQGVMTSGVLSALAIAAALDGFRHGFRRKRRAHSSSSDKSSAKTSSSRDDTLEVVDRIAPGRRDQV